MMNDEKAKWVDGFGREINYLRLSVTDRCNFRCTYCMAEDMQFLPKQRLLSFEEFVQIGRVMSDLGVSKIRLTGGEPLVRQDIVDLARELSHIDGVDKLAITTNGSRLDTLAKPLFEAGVHYLNISLDTLNADQFRRITRTGELDAVLAGIKSAQAAGFEHIKLNAVILKGQNDSEISDLLNFALDQTLDISFIEEMPLGQIDSHQRVDSFFSSDDVKETISQKHQLIPSMASTGGPSKYFTIPGYSSRIGFISPLSNNFCASCNRVRLTAEGKLLLCLGNESAVDLKAIVRRYPGQASKLKEELLKAIKRKPEKHHFDPAAQDHIVRFMNMTGG